MKFRRSLQRSLLTLLGSFAFLISVFYALLSLVIAYVVEDEFIENLLDMEALRIESVYAETSELLLPRQEYMKLYQGLASVPLEVQSVLRAEPHKQEVFGAQGRHYHVRRLRAPSLENYYLIGEVSELLVVTHFSGRFFTLYVSVFILAGAFTLWLVYRISIKISSPLVRFTIQISKNRVLDTGNPKIYNDELHYLQSVVSRAITELETGLQREQNFSRDLSHELRTPLTIMQNTLALAECRELRNSELESLRNNVLRINSSVDALLALARSESEKLESFSAVELIEQVLLDNHSLMNNAHFEVNFSGEDRQVHGNRRLMELVVSNLLRNAMDHSLDGCLSISVGKNELTFENNARNGLVGSPLDAGNKRAGSPGMGIGLFLVKRILEKQGWSYDISTGKSHFKFSIALPSC